MPRKPARPAKPPAPLPTRLARLTGTEPGQRPTPKEVADTLGVSRSSARRYLAGRPMAPRVEARLVAAERAEARRPTWIRERDRGPLGQTLVGQTRDVPGSRKVADQLAVVYGDKDGKVNVRRAAQGQGVSESTVRRWVKGASRPSTEHQRALRAEVRETVTTKNKRTSRMQNRGASVSVAATVVVSNQPRRRVIGGNGQIKLSAEDMQAITESWRRGGDASALSALKHAIRNSSWGREVGLEDDDLRFGLQGVQHVQFR